jgi:His-Xaa-Ser system protein HxsD
MGSHGGVEYSLDDLGGYATISVDTRVFSEAAILKTAYWLTDQYYLYLFRDNAHPESKLIVELRLKKQGDHNSLENACRVFSNQLLDQEVRQVVQAETSGLRDSLVQKAFFEGRPQALAG